MKIETVETVLGQLSSGDSIFIPGSSAEPRALVEAIQNRSSTLPALEILHSFVPGINQESLAAPGNSITETTLFPRPGCASVDTDVSLIPCSYYGFGQYLSQRNINWCFVQVAPPDARGRYCLGPAVEFLPQVMGRGCRIVGLINDRVPVIPGSSYIEASVFRHVCEIETPLVSYDPGEADEVSKRISSNLSSLIDDGSTLQLGLGKVPSRLSKYLVDRRRLSFHTGLLTDGYFTLLEAGALNEEAGALACVALGNLDFYSRLGDAPGIKVAGVEFTHSPVTLGRLDSLIAINSALEVDLFGQANLEFMRGKQVSSVGGAADFSRAARLAVGGKSIIALPATAAGGTQSRIVAQLSNEYPVSLTRYDIDYLVTEYGVARISGKSDASRAKALVDLAAPQFREGLERQLAHVD